MNDQICSIVEDFVLKLSISKLRIQILQFKGHLVFFAVFT